ncbi:ArsR family transcriptional regulator [Streptomyces albireticuli]|uniref:ArsR family transcriptional regulator n=1 Tax=Streptomyces albireticuli TaxID=1940 RepID=A0A1Z2KUM0_9ACTN|nr:ArsR family transcriptional regulator [Streptomyces albireticuli]
MSVSIDIAGLPPERIVFETSPLAELNLALHALAEPGHHPGLRGWASATAASLGRDLAGRLHEADFLWRNTFSDLFMPFAGVRGGDRRAGATLAEDLDLLDRLDDEQFVSAALEFASLATYATGGPSPLTDAATRARALELAAARGPQQWEFTGRLLKDPTAVRAWVRRLVEDCDEAFFADVWQRVRGVLAADVRHKTELLRRKGLAEALTAVSPAMVLEEDGQGRRIRADKLAECQATAVDPAVGVGLTFVPSHFAWPHLMILHRPGWRPVVHYPVGSPELPAPASVEVLKLRLEALAHPVRMQLCRSTARSPHTTGELANILGISAPEVSRHLAVLRKAGLIVTRRRGRYVLYQLDVRAVSRLSSDFLEGVLR